MTDGEPTMIKTVVVIYYENDSEKQIAMEKATAISGANSDVKISIQKIEKLEYLNFHYSNMNYRINTDCLDEVLRRDFPKGGWEIISVATRNRIASLGINSIDQILQLSVADLKAIPGLGKKGIDEVKALFDFMKVDLPEIRKF